MKVEEKDGRSQTVRREDEGSEEVCANKDTSNKNNAFVMNSQHLNSIMSVLGTSHVIGDVIKTAAK